MGTFADFNEPARQEVTLSQGQTISVRGLALIDISYFVQNHLGEIVKAVETWQGSGQSFNSSKAIGQIITTIAKDFPKLTAEIISVAADEPEQIEKIKRLSFFGSVACLSAIMKATMEDTAELKNILAGLKESLNVALQQTTMLSNPPKIESPSSTSDSAET